AFQANGVKIISNGRFIAFFYHIWIEIDKLACFNINKAFGCIIKIKMQLLFFIHHVKQNHFVLVMLQMSKCFKQLFLIISRLEHIRKKENQRTSVNIFSYLV